MYAEIILTTAEGGARKVQMLSNGATPIRYKGLFHTDLMIEVMNFVSNSQIDENTFSRIVDMVPKLAYIMAMSAEHKDMTKLNMDGYISWLEDFSSETFTMHSWEIINVYFDTTKIDSDLKNQ